MEFIVTCIAGGSRPELDTAFVQSMTAALWLQGVRVKSHRAHDDAMVLTLSAQDGGSIKTLHDLIQELTTGQSIDAIIQPSPAPRYKLLISDMDSTMIACECIDELADFGGKKTEVSAITARAMNGELDFEAALTKRVALLAGLPESTLQECYDDRVELMQGAKALLTAHKESGGYSVLVSGGFTFFTSRVAKELGFDEHYGNTLEIVDGKLTGKVIAPILGKEAKLATLHYTCTKLGITTDEALAIGDGANDLPMLLAAGLGVAYHAKPNVQAQARACVNHGDLGCLIPLTG